MEVILHTLEDRNIYVSAGSACSSNKPAISSTLQSIGLKKELLDSTVRFSFSIHTTKEELDASLAQAKARSEEIRKQFNPTPTQQTNSSAFANRMPAVGNPSASSSSASVSFEDLARLNPASPEYAEMRRQLGLR